MMCGKLFAKNFYGIAYLLPFSPPFFSILLNYFRASPQEKVILPLKI